MPILAIGVSHHQATTDQLTNFTRCAQQLVAPLAADPRVNGLIELSTCNRHELYVDTEHFHSTMRTAKRLLAEFGAGDLVELIDPLAARNGVEHLIRVTCGLESMVVGEPEIIGQVRAALNAHPQRVSPALQRLFQLALNTAKAITSQTPLGALGRNLASVALDLVEQRYGPLNARPALLLGTGAYAGAVAADLLGRGAQVSVHSASGRAAAFARTHQIDAVDSAELTAEFGRAALVVSCSGQGGRTLTAHQLAASRSVQQAVLPIVDLAVSRDIDPLLSFLYPVEVIDLDEIGRHAPAEQAETLATAHRLVQEAVDKYLASERERLADPAVRAMREHVNQVIDNEIAAVASRAEPAVAAAVARSLRRVAGVLLHTPSLRAAELARSGDPEDVSRAIETVFGVRVPR